MILTQTGNNVFQPGDTVRLNIRKPPSKVRDRQGTVVGHARKAGHLRVLWNGLKRPQIVQEALLELAEGERPALAPRELVLEGISEELERLRDARLERHLRWPREIPLNAYRPDAPRERFRPKNHAAQMIGLIGVSMALGAAYLMIMG